MLPNHALALVSQKWVDCCDSSVSFLDGPSLPVARAGVGGILPAPPWRVRSAPGTRLCSGLGCFPAASSGISTATLASPRDTQQDDMSVDPPSRVMSGSG